MFGLTITRNAPKAGAKNTLMNRAARMMQTVSYKAHIQRANVWRSQYNPLRSLTIPRAVHHLEAGERGSYAELQWLYRYIERRDAVLGALVDRRLAAIEKLDWDIKIREELDDDQQARAEEQRKALKSAYSNIDNFADALGDLAHASFRGFTHLQKIVEDGKVCRLENIEQWFWVRDGIDGAWQFNGKSTFGAVKGDAIDESDFIIREIERPINEVAVICFIRKSLSQKDWDAFVEVYGVPAIFITLPPEIGDQAEQYQEAAESIIGNMRGTLPGGSDVKTVDNGARGVNPFRDHLKYQDEMLVLRGTGGKLTMLNDATGIGGGQGEVHQDAFDEIATAEGTKIAQLIRASLDEELLIQEGFGDEEPLVYFDLGVNEETDSGEYLAGAATLHAMGKSVDDAQIEEKTGYKISAAAEVLSEELEVRSEDARLMNRASRPLEEAAMAAMHAAQVADNAPLYDRLAEALQAESSEDLIAAMKEFSAELPEWIGATAAQESVWEKLLSDSYEEGAGFDKSEEDMISNNCGTGKEGFKSGNKCGGNQKGTSREGKTRNHSRDQFGTKLGNKPLSPAQNKERLGKSIDHALKKKKTIHGAAHREELGRIDLPWGTPGDKGNDYRGGKGLSHVLAKHGEKDARKLSEVLSEGKITQGKTPNKREITLNEYKAVVVKDKETRSWLLTGYTKDGN